MKEYKKNTNGADVLHQKKEQVEETSAQRAPVGEFVAHNFVGHKPADENAGQEAYDG